MSSAPARPEAYPASDAWFTRSKLLGLLVVCVIMAFPTVLIGINSFFYRDMGQFGYPLAAYHREAFWRGEMPLWNPYNNCGLPFLAQWNTLVLYPGSLLYLLLPLPWSMNVFVLAHLVLAGVGMFTLAKRWTTHGFAASIAGLAFAWNGLTLHSLMWPNNMAALGWMPWVVLAMERAGREGGRRVPLAALTGAMQMLAGAPEIILLTWIITGLLWLRDLLGGEAPRVKLILRFSLAGALVFALSAAQLLPFLKLLAHSQRDSGFGGADWSMPGWGWANFLAPMFGCTPSVTGVFSQDAQQWTSSYYMGIGTVVFALLAWRSSDGRVKWLTGFLLAGLFLALGETGHVLPWLKKICPLLGFVRFPIKFVVLVVFALPLLAAFGVAKWQTPSKDQNARRQLTLPVILVLAALGGIILLAVVRPVAGTTPSIIAMNAVWRGLLLCGMAAGLIFARVTAARARWLLTLVLLLTAGDVLTHMPRQNPVVPNGVYGPIELELSHVPALGESRAMIAPPMQEILSGFAYPDPAIMYTGHRQMLLNDCNLLEHVPKVNGFYSLYLREADEVIRRLYRTPNYYVPLLNFLGVSQLTDPAAAFKWHASANYLPIISAGQAPMFATPAEDIEAIFSPAFNPRSLVYLPPEAKEAASTVRPGQCVILSTNFGREIVSAEVRAAAPSLVVIAQALDSNWRATVDGQPAALWKANHAFQALVVPSGDHHVELRYVDRAFQAGAALSVLSLLGCTVLAWRRPRK